MSAPSKMLSVISKPSGEVADVQRTVVVASVVRTTLLFTSAMITTTSLLQTVSLFQFCDTKKSSP